jgi:methionyl-tRNA synthetase
MGLSVRHSRGVSDWFYITTAIDYVNGQPHLGHAYEKIITDVIARTRRSLGQNVFFLTGLDEHGQKVQQAALAEGRTPQEYCDRLAEDWQSLARELQLSNDDFVRTTEERHRLVVQAILMKLHRAGHFRLGVYEGWYSAKEETFLTDKDRLPDGTFPANYGEVTPLSEKNYFFPLKPHQAWLIDHIERNPDFILPEYRRNEVLGFLRSQELEDLCISRPRARLEWGIPLPFDPEFVTYVWFDALTNYVTSPVSHGDAKTAAAIGLTAKSDGPALWPAVHVIGKDILKFHAVYWPIMLRAAELPLPRQILAHGWWQKDGQKLSKTTGNVVDPIEVIRTWGLDAFRYYVTRELDIGPDGNWTDSGFASRYQSELANGLGNLVNRAISMLRRYRNGITPAVVSVDAPGTAADQEWLGGPLPRRVAKSAEAARDLAANFKLQAALISIWDIVSAGNQFVEARKPFKLAKDASPAAQTELDEVLYCLVETCRILAVLLWPFIPGTAERIYRQLGLDGAPDRFAGAAWGGLQKGHAVGEPQPLFPRKE